MTEDIRLWSDTDKIKYLFSTTDKSVINCFGKFVFDSFEKHRKHSTVNTHTKGKLIIPANDDFLALLCT